MAYVGKMTDTDGVTGLVGSTLYGTCATAAATAAKVVTLADFDELMTGITIHVKFTNANTASAPTLNVNSTGAKAIYRNGAAVGSGAWQAGQVVSFTYTGSQWETNESGHVVVQSGSTTTNYRPIMLGYTNTTTIADLAATTINQVYANTSIFAQPSTGKIFAKEFNALNTNDTPTATLHSGGLWLKSYIEGASATYNYNETVLKTYAGKLKSNNGMLITLQGGGLTIVGGGESATSLANLIDNDQSTDTTETPTAKLDVGGTLDTKFVGDTEQLLLSSDNNIYFITACQTIANRKPVVLDTSLQFYPGTTNTGSIGTSSYKWGSVYATNINGKLYTTATNPSSETLYYIPFISGATSGNYDQLVNDGLGYRSKEGTTSAIGFGLICLGNNVASGTAGNKKGYIRMYAASQNYSQIETTATATRAVVIPDMAGNFSILNKNSTGYWGLYDGDASMSNWIRTTTSGFIPVEAGGLDDPHSSLGTSTWAFKNAYIANIYTNKIFPASGVYYNNNSGFASAPWAKTVDFTCTTASVTRWYAFRVYQAYEGTNISSGLLIVSITTNADKVYSSGKVVWVYAAGSLDKDNFAVTYTNTASTSTTIEIWAKCTKRYQGWNVIPLYGGWGSGKGDIGINCYSTTTGAAAYTGTLIASSYSDLKNNAISATTASKLGSTTVGGTGLPIYLSSGTATACSVPASGAWWNTSNILVPQISTSGVMDIGRYVDFHNTAASTANYNIRLDNASTTSLRFSEVNTTAGANFSPATTAKYDLGTSSLKWRYIYGDLNGSIYSTNTEGDGTTDTTDGTWAIPFVSGTSSGYKSIRANDGIQYITANGYNSGSESGIGHGTLVLGNDIDDSADTGCKIGRIRLFGRGTNYTTISASMVLDSNKTITIPNYSGTVMVTGIGDALTSSNDIDTDTKDITKHWYSASAAVSATIAHSPVTSHGYHVFNVTTTSTNGTFQKQLLFGNTYVIPYMYRYLYNGSWSGGWRSPGTGFFYVIGTQTTTTKLWTGALPLPALYDGLTIAYYLPYSVAASQSSEVGDTSSNSNVWINLTLSNGSTTGWIQAYYQSNSRITTHYGAGSCIILTYFKAGSIKVSGTATTVDSWRHCDYNANSSVNVTLNTTSKAYVLATTSTPTSTATARTAVADTGVYLDTTTGMITATTFNGAATKLSTNAGSEIRPVYFTNGVPTNCAATYGSVTGYGYTSSKPYYKIAETIDIESSLTQYRICFLVSRRKTGDSTMGAIYGILCVHFETGTTNGSFGTGSAKWLAVENDFDVSNVSVVCHTISASKFKMELWIKLSNSNDVVIVKSLDVLGFSYAANYKVWSFIGNPTGASSTGGYQTLETKIPVLQNNAGGGQKLLYNGSITISATGNQLSITNLDHYQTLLVELWHGTAGKSFRFICPVQYVLAQTPELVAFQTSDQLTSSNLSSGNVKVKMTTTSITLLIAVSGYSGTTATVRIYSI